jgi:hypothetical protein
MTKLSAKTGYSNVYYMVLARTIDICACGWIWRNYDITISSMCGLELRKIAPKKWAVILGGILNKIQANHCELAIAADIERAMQALGTLERFK